MENLIKAKPHLRRTLRVSPVLKALGLPRACRWNEASARLKLFLVEARRVQDIELASRLSEVKAFLKRNLSRECSCGAVIAAGNLNCRTCRDYKLHGT